MGTLLLAATPTGLVRVAYEREGLDAVLGQPGRTRSAPGSCGPPGGSTRLARQLEEYFTGRRTNFDLPLDLRLSAGFRRSVLAYLPAIGYGQTASYQSVAAAVHNPKAVRAVGTACATNPLPVVIPCHRVIRSDGQLGAYLGGARDQASAARPGGTPMTANGHRASAPRTGDGLTAPTGRASQPNSTTSAAPCCHVAAHRRRRPTS